ncbi:ABC transporter permease [Gelidibacter salicanalis]|uniref:ABC transporter permease n=1 Tax=Gelidibacter salicanalis TaxID=291193 RepID=A0A934NI32_9FLAO|nr:ABC transporter permease [Gelidibacter salicanalis]MBJ7879614.1 ABC transporter permease [Gelidibacter salicanalis]
MKISYYLKIVYRNFISQRPYSFLNLIGLSIGLSIAFIALLSVTEHTGYDTHHENSKQIHRLLLQNSFDNEKTRTINLALTHRFKEDIPEINNMFVFHLNYLRVQDSIVEPEMIGASPEIFDVLSFDIIEGGVHSFNTELKTIVISESTALKHFGETPVVGKTIAVISDNFFGQEADYGTNAEYTIVAVFKDFPKKSFFKPTLIIPIENSKRYHSEKEMIYQGGGYQTFLSLANNTSAKKVVDKINEIGKEIDEKYDGKGTVYSLQAIADIHLFSDDVNEIRTGSIKEVLFYVIIGTLVLTISLLNFLLLYTAVTKRRFKELSIHKVHGLNKSGLLKLFLFEAMSISVVSAGIAVFLMKLAIPVFNEFTNSKLEFNSADNYGFIIYGIVLIVFIAMLTGAYFAFYVWRHNTIETLSGSTSKKGHNFFLKNDAVVVQIGIVAFMLIFSIGFYKQLDYMINSDKGYNPNNLIAFSIPKSKTAVIKEGLLRYPLIDSVTIGQTLSLPNGLTQTMIIKVNGVPKAVKLDANEVDSNYIPIYQLELIKGQNFTEAYKRDDVIINEAAVKHLGLGDDPLGENQFVGNVIGVLKDFHFSSFHKVIEPYIFLRKDESAQTSSKFESLENITIKYRNGDYKEVVQIINKIKEENNLSVKWDPPSDLSSLYEKSYQNEKTFQKAILILTALAIFITILGLIGMSLFKTQQKTKEIGIRKVNGATVTEIMLMLNKDFIKWVVIAFVIACPIAYYAMRKWLENFAYKTSLSWWVFALAGVFTLVIALVTVSWQTYRAATRNPVESLRDE